MGCADVPFSGAADSIRLPAIIATEKRFFVLLGCFFAAHVLLRLLISPLADIDESWQLVLSQEWRLGYTAHPPLYTWL